MVLFIFPPCYYRVSETAPAPVPTLYSPARRGVQRRGGRRSAPFRLPPHRNIRGHFGGEGRTRTDAEPDQQASVTVSFVSPSLPEEPPGTSQSILEPPGTSWNLLEPPGTSWSLLEAHHQNTNLTSAFDHCVVNLSKSRFCRQQRNHRSRLFTGNPGGLVLGSEL